MTTFKNTLPFLIALTLAGAGLIWLVSTDNEPEAALAAEVTASDCLPLTNSKADHFSEEAVRRAIDARIVACRLAAKERQGDSLVKVALAKALTTQDRTETVSLLREAAAQNDAEALFQLFEQHRSWDRHLDRDALVTRVEAEQALRRAAELGHREAAYRLAIALDRGRILKRDPAQARLWAARVAENVPPDTRRDDILVFFGRLLSASDEPAEKQRGRKLLEEIVAAGSTFNARTVLAEVIRKSDPVRARALLESALRSDPGGATPVLADMLIKGEGGPADPRRAVKLLQVSTDVPGIHGALGQLYLKGELITRDIAKAINLIRHAAVWDYDALLQTVQLLATNPEVRVTGSDHILYDGREAAELDEPGAALAIANLRLSANVQFRDVADGCQWINVARQRGLSVSSQQATSCQTQ